MQNSKSSKQKKISLQLLIYLHVPPQLHPLTKQLCSALIRWSWSLLFPKISNLSLQLFELQGGVLIEPCVSLQQDNLSVSTSASEAHEFSGMGLNPHWLANGGVKPTNWRSYCSLLKYHFIDMQCFKFDISVGGKVTCQTCANCPGFADRGAKVSREDGYFGQPKTGYKWEFFKAHLETKEHKQCLKESDPEKSHPKVNNLMAEINACTETGKIAQLKRLTNTVHYMVKRTVPNDHLEDLVLLQKANGCDMGEQYHTHYGFGEVLESLDSIVLEDIKQKVCQRRFIGGKGDGETDKGMLSQEAGSCRIVNFETGLPEEIFMGLEGLEEEDAEAVFSALRRLCRKIGISDEKFDSCVSNFNLDGASVNLGCNDSVKTRLIAAVKQMIVVHCVNHSLELVVSVAAKGHIRVEEAVSTLEEVFKFYHYSPKKLRHLKRTAEIFNQTLDHFGGVKQIRWCASQQRSWVAMYDNYEMVVDHLGQIQNDMSSFKKEDRDKAGALLLRVTNIHFVMMMHLMIDLLDTVGQVSVKMQSPLAIILDVPGHKETLLNTIFNIRSCTTVHIHSFLQSFDTSTFMWRRVKLSKFRHAGTIDAWLNQGQHDSPAQTVKSKFADYFAPFLDDITHNIHARFDVYTVDDHLLSKF